MSNDDTVTIELTRKEALLMQLLTLHRMPTSSSPIISEYVDEVRDGGKVYDKFADATGTENSSGELLALLNSIASTPHKLGCRTVTYSESGIDLGDDYKLTPKQLRAMADKCEEG